MAQEFIVSPGQSIQAAITVANDYDTIRVLPGTYTGPIVINKMIQLLGAQAGVDARTRTGAPGTESIITGTSVTALVQLAANNVVVDGFTIQGNTAGAGAYSLPTFSGYWFFNNIVQNNVFGFYVNSNGETETQVRQNIFNNNNQAGASTGNGVYSDQGIQNLLIDSNRFTGPHANASINMATNASDVVIVRNEMLTDNSIALIDTTNVTIACNTLTNTQGSSIFFGGGTNRTDINNNILHNSISNGISVTTAFVPGPNSNIRAKHNNIQGNANAGLNIAAGAYAVAPRLLDATNNWWGAPDGPSGAGSGSGDAILLNGNPPTILEFEPFLQSPPLPCSTDLACQAALEALQQQLAACRLQLANCQNQSKFKCQNPNPRCINTAGSQRCDKCQRKSCRCKK
ncbi:hypothetical protein MHZ95_00795 [Sporosarcina sp. ACRSM]|uniref:right-handed parallel beta-helix repeat-containing protein n=1 Tax=Sporosarcina sp. ACRSM TaxID=2918216 RepID=UPI001EF576E0|nr:hypothetical protein [Sporosarcina sp. ACRSM]MCG7333807.1 hypothetical protein [Sporosarcina sp. ACRSM]